MSAVLHTVPSLDNKMGGLVHAALTIAKGLVVAGQETEVAATVASGDDLEHLETAFSTVPHRLFRRRFPAHYFHSPEMRGWLRRNVSRYSIVEIHGVFSFTAVDSAWACRARGVPYVLRPQGSLDPFDLRKHRRLKSVYGPLVLRRMIEGADHVVVASEMEAERLMTFGAPPREVVVPLPVDLPVGPRDGASFRQRHGIPADAFVVLFLSRIDHQKGLPLLLPSLAKLKDEVPDLWFVLAGSGEQAYEEYVLSLLRSHGMLDWTTRCGFLGVPEKYDAYAASQVFALPSLFENFGIVVVEAMRAGLPLLLSDEVYIHKLIADAGAAEICQRTAGSCEAALRRLISDRSRLATMGARSREVAEEHFSVEAATAPLLRLYADIAARRRSGDVE